jgi:retinol dehydrogenase 12
VPRYGASDNVAVVASADRDLDGIFVVITGANTGIGRATAEALAARGAKIALACRSEERTRPVLDGIASRGGDAFFVPLDLGAFDSVRSASARIEALERPIDILINNAGVAGQRGFTTDGFELAFGTNHLGHFLFTLMLASRLREARHARIVNVSSHAHHEAKGIDFAAVRKGTRSVTGLPEYAVSKLANILFTRELARRIGPSGVRSYALHPGMVASDAWRRMPWPIRPLIKLRMISNEDGAKTSIYCATSGKVASDDGRYYDRCQERTPSAISQDATLANELWERSLDFTGAPALRHAP